MSPASAVACHAHLPGMKALAGASLGRPLRAARRTVSSPHWWDLPQSGSVVTWQHRPVIQCGPRPCQVDRGHSIFLHHCRRRTVVLPARVRQICVLSFICALCCTVSFCIVFISRWAFRRVLLVCGIAGRACCTPPPLACSPQLRFCLPGIAERCTSAPRTLRGPCRVQSLPHVLPSPP